MNFTLRYHCAVSRRPCRRRHQNKYSRRNKRYFSISDVLIGSVAQQARYDTDSAVSFPWVKWPESETDLTTQFSAGIKMRGATTPVLVCLHGMVFHKTMERGSLPITRYSGQKQLILTSRPSVHGAPVLTSHQSSKSIVCKSRPRKRVYGGIVTT
jgi:hypothetical protein